MSGALVAATFAGIILPIDRVDRCVITDGEGGGADFDARFTLWLEGEHAGEEEEEHEAISVAGIAARERGAPCLITDEDGFPAYRVHPDGNVESIAFDCGHDDAPDCGCAL